jgi:membrane-associated phospholipid phosphatase
MAGGRFSSAFKHYRPLLAVAVLYALAVSVQALAYCDVPLAEFSKLFLAAFILFSKCFLILLGLAAGAFLRGMYRAPPPAGKTRIRQGLDDLSRAVPRYMEGEVFAYGCAGFAVLCILNIFFLQKAMLPCLNPYSWDPFFAALDKALHFGRLPHEYFLALPGAPQLGRLFDLTYMFWFVIMDFGVGFCFWWDRDLKRRLRFMWVFLLSWILLGSLAAVAMASVGPTFYGDFYGSLPNPYADFQAFINQNGEAHFPVTFKTRGLLLEWATNGKPLNANAISAMPSMHVAIAWLVALYGWQIHRRLGIALISFALLTVGATIYLGLHYALDSYVSIACVSLMWWIAGRLLDRRYAGRPLLKDA